MSSSAIETETFAFIERVNASSQSWMQVLDARAKPRGRRDDWDSAAGHSRRRRRWRRL